jgi:NADH dehydrogenase
MKDIAVFGGTGFVGSYMIEKLIANGYFPNVLVREDSKQKLAHPDKCSIVTGDIASIEKIKETINGTEAVIYLIGIIRQFPKMGITFEELHFQRAKQCMDTAQEMGVKRFILMSANGVKPNGTDYQTTKFHADQYLKDMVLDWTVFRPSLIFGDPQGKIEFCSQLRDDMLSLPFPAPLFYTGILPKNAGSFSLSPIHVKNVAEFFVKALSDKSTIGKTYELGGLNSFSWKEVISIISASSGKKKWKFPAPVFPIKMIASVFDRFTWFPITRDQLAMLLEGNICDSKNLFEEFDIEPLDFSVTNLSYLHPE